MYLKNNYCLLGAHGPNKTKLISYNDYAPRVQSPGDPPGQNICIKKSYQNLLESREPELFRGTLGQLLNLSIIPLSPS